MEFNDSQSLHRIKAEFAGRYVVEEVVGRGGMAVVYRAHDVKHDRRVAIKVLNPELAASVAADRFLRETRIAAGLQHPGILLLIDSGTVRGLPFYVMPYVDGESLRDRLEREGALPIEVALDIARQVARALDHAHRQGIVHRDVKPENIMLSGHHAVVADFGIARAILESGAARLTGTGLVIGTPTYMSPEQWSDSGLLDGRSDVYALSCVLFEMLAGEPPFQGATAQALLARHSTETPPPIGAFRATVSPAVEATITKGLAKTPADRFATALEFADALDAPGDTGLASQELPKRARPRLPKRALWAAAVVLAGAAGAMGVRALWPGTVSSESDRVVVAAFVNETGDPALDHVGRMAAHEITLGLQRANQSVVPSPVAVQASNYLRNAAGESGQRDPVDALATETGARFVVSGSYYQRGDSLSFQVQLTDAGSGRALAPPDAVSALTADPGATISELGQRVIGQLARYRDERIALTAAVGQPPTIESYRAFSAGLDRYVRNEFRAALPHFREAAALDSTAVLGLLYAALCHNNLAEWAQTDSLAAVVDRQSDRLTEYDRAWLTYIRMQAAGNHEEARLAIRRAADLAPESKASYNLAWAALQTNRPREALAALANLDPDRGAMRDWFQYWAVLTDALHRTGDHETELESARQARRRHPDQIGALRLEADALIALGRDDELESLLDELQGHGAGVQTGSVFHGMAMEARAHGNGPLARSLLERAGRQLVAAGQDSGSVAHRSWRVAVLSDAGKFEEAERLVQRLEQEQPDNFRYRAWMGLQAARSSSREEAIRISDWLANLGTPYLFGGPTLHRARIAALLGDRDQAVNLLSEAFEKGFAIPRHADANFTSLYSWAPFRRLLEPRG